MFSSENSDRLLKEYEKNTEIYVDPGKNNFACVARIHTYAHAHARILVDLYSLVEESEEITHDDHDRPRQTRYHLFHLIDEILLRFQLCQFH